MNAEADRPLLETLEEARSLGFLGPGPVRRQLDHARGFGIVAETVAGGPLAVIADLGSGGGLPGLVLAHDWAHARVTLVEVQGRRADALRRFADSLGLGARVEVVEQRAEEVAHLQSHRETYDLVTARSFGPPAVTAEIGAGLVRLGAWLVVSEPPGGDVDRWPIDPMQELGFGAPALASASGASYMAAQKQRPTLSETPRNATKLAKSPLWRPRST